MITVVQLHNLCKSCLRVSLCTAAVCRVHLNHLCSSLWYKRNTWSLFSFFQFGGLWTKLYSLMFRSRYFSQHHCFSTSPMFPLFCVGLVFYPFFFFFFGQKHEAGYEDRGFCWVGTRWSHQKLNFVLKCLWLHPPWQRTSSMCEQW